MLINIEISVKDEEFTQEIIKRNPNAKINYIENYKDLDKENIPENSFTLINYKGDFLEKCPGTPNYICCNYYVIHWAIGCPFDCTYCYLHGYKNFPGILIHANMSDLSEEIENKLSSNPNINFRIGTGEYTDSLALEEKTGFNKLFLPKLLSFTNVILELKTKFAAENILQLINLDKDLTKGYTDKLVFAWSINPPKIVSEEEHKASLLKDRIKSAQICQNHGYKVALHFDPVIYYESWDRDYENVIDDIFEFLDPSLIAWVSLGTLRFNSRVKKASLEKFPETKIYYGELLPGVDGKLRYFRPLRISMYKKIYAWLTRYISSDLLYFCMESQNVWDEVFGYNYKKNSLLF